MGYLLRTGKGLGEKEIRRQTPNEANPDLAGRSQLPAMLLGKHLAASLPRPSGPAQLFHISLTSQ